MLLKNHKKQLIVPYRARLLLLLITAIPLFACEAPLNLKGVESSKSSPIRRTDIFMAATTSGGKSIIVGSEGLVVTAEAGTRNWQRDQVATKPTFIDITSCRQGLLAAVTMEGDVWISADHANTWSAHDLGTSEIPQGLTCDPLGGIWVVGSFGTILSSSDSGNTWVAHSLDEDIILSTVQFIDERNGFIMGEFGTVLITRDGGSNWELGEPVPNEFFPLSSIFKDTEYGWVTGLNGTIYSTLDGGATWRQEKTHTNAALFGVSIINDTLITVGNYGTVFHKNVGSDPNTGWEPLEIPIESRFFFRVIHPLDNSKIIIAGGAGSLDVIDLKNTSLVDADIN